MSKKSNLFEFLGDALNDKDLKESGENLKLGDIISNNVPKRTSIPLTNLTTQNTLAFILDISKKSNFKSSDENENKKEV